MRGIEVSKIDTIPAVAQVIENAERIISELLSAPVKINLYANRKKEEVTFLSQIAAIVSHESGIKWPHIQSATRKQDVVNARHLYCLFARVAGYGLTDIGKSLNRDHTTIMYAVNVAHERVQLNDPLTMPLYNRIKSALYHDDETQPTGNQRHCRIGNVYGQPVAGGRNGGPADQMHAPAVCN